jgi:metallophosphoesterase (TIGR00282 family)
VRILFLGDIVGKPGRRVLRDGLAAVRSAYAVDLVVANAENATGGSGLDVRCYNELRQAGVDAFTLGDHCYKRKEVISLFQSGAPICRPANYPPDAPGPDHVLIETADGTQVALLALLGRLFMRPVDCPLRASDRVLAAVADRTKVIVVDMHAEATSDKQIALRHLAGRVSAVIGTHTHVPTADAVVFEPGTAFISDVGMTGPYDGVIGRRWDRVLKTAHTFNPTFFSVATGDPRISGAIIDVDTLTGRATSINLLHLRKNDIDSLSDRTESGPEVRVAAESVPDPAVRSNTPSQAAPHI